MRRVRVAAARYLTRVDFNQMAVDCVVSGPCLAGCQSDQPAAAPATLAPIEKATSVPPP